MGNKTILVHLSDIHFGKPGLRGQFDLDRSLRDEVERDLGILRTALGPTRGIIISGDIAYSGQAEQYTLAIEWLKKVAGIVGCAPENVWVVPGNHDVDRAVIRGSSIVKDFHALVRRKGADHVDEQLREKAQDPLMGEVFLAPMKNYNDFAAKFGCQIAADKLVWKTDEQSDVKLNDGSSLRLVGLTSTWLSDETDSTGDNKLALGTAQLHMPRLNGVEYLTICHHPPQWLLDEDAVETKLRALARIRLSGHKHRRDACRVGDGLCLTAGAVHPDRAESQWSPCYNVLALEVKNTGERNLQVDVFTRVWNDAKHSFVAESGDGGQPASFTLPLPAFVATPPSTPTAASTMGISTTATLPAQKAVATAPRLPMDPARTLSYRFLLLPLHKKIEICHELGLLPEQGAPPIDTTFFVAAFKSTKDRGELARLWDAVESQRGSAEPNPYR